MWRWDGDGCVWQRVSHTAYPEHIETDRIFRYEPYDPDIDRKMNSVTVRDASANDKAFTHNVDKQKHKYKKKEDWVWDYLIRRSVISAERK